MNKISDISIERIKNNNIYGGIICSFLITIFQINEFVLLGKDSQSLSACLICLIWVISKLLVMKVNVNKEPRYRDFGKVFILNIFQCEWYTAVETQKQSAYYGFIQILFITVPTNIVNILLLSDTSSRDGYYTFMIFLNLVFISFWFFKAIYSWTPVQFSCNRLLTIIPSLFAHISYWYLLVQCFIFNGYIGFSLILINCLIGLIDFVFYQNISSSSSEDIPILYFKLILKYGIQINSHSFLTYKKWSEQLLVENWKDLLPLGVQCLNLFILFITKLNYCPLIISLDKGFYILFAFSAPQFIIFANNLYYKLIVIRSYHLIQNLGEKEFFIKKKHYTLLTKQYCKEQKFQFTVPFENLKEENKRFFLQNVNQIVMFLKFAKLKSKNNITVEIQDVNKSFQIDLTYNGYYQISQKLKLQKNFLDYSDNEQILSYLTFVFDSHKSQQIEVSSYLKQPIERVLINIQTCNQLEYYLFHYEIELIYQYFIRQAILDSIRIRYLQILTFNKMIQQFIPINPSLILYDLFLDNN